VVLHAGHGGTNPAAIPTPLLLPTNGSPAISRDTAATVMYFDIVTVTDPNRLLHSRLNKRKESFYVQFVQYYTTD
jgi:hypothetical protein